MEEGGVRLSSRSASTVVRLDPGRRVRQLLRMSSARNDRLVITSNTGRRTSSSKAGCVRAFVHSVAMAAFASEPPDTLEMIRTSSSRRASARSRSTPRAARVARNPPPESARRIAGVPGRVSGRGLRGGRSGSSVGQRPSRWHGGVASLERSPSRSPLPCAWRDGWRGSRHAWFRHGWLAGPDLWVKNFSHIACSLPSTSPDE